MVVVDMLTKMAAVIDRAIIRFKSVPVKGRITLSEDTNMGSARSAINEARELQRKHRTNGYAKP